MKVKVKDLVGRACIVHRVDSPGNGKMARIDRVEPDAPFPLHATWGQGEEGGAWFMAGELEPSRLAL
jgi:hypothetical protein